jgi:hypothetical protein
MNLENNSKEMNSVVQTYIEEETTTLIYDNEQLDKWNEMIKELGIQGQESVVSDSKSPIPFKWLNETEMNIVKELCPREVDFKQYDKTPIPLAILELISMSIKEDYFNEIKIYYNEKEKDPFAIGINETYALEEKDSYRDHKDKSIFRTKEDAEAYVKTMGYTDAKVSKRWGDTRYYAIGRWGDVKQSWDQLRKAAKKIFIGLKTADVNRRILEAKRDLEDLDHKVIERFGV